MVSLPEQVYVDVIAGVGGLWGGYFAAWITAVIVAEMRGSSGLTASGYAWVFSTGGRGSATWGDVWRYRGGGPESTRVQLPWILFLCSAVVVWLGISFPPPPLASGAPVPYWSWPNIGWPAGLFVCAYWTAVLLVRGQSDDHDRVLWGAHCRAY